jgi:hypothetical protein
VNNRNKRAQFLFEQGKDIWCRPDDSLKVLQGLFCIQGKRKISVLAGPDRENGGAFMPEKIKFSPGKGRMTKGTFEVLRSLLVPLCHAPVSMDNHVMIVSHAVDLDPSVFVLMSEKPCSLIRNYTTGAFDFIRYTSQ